MQIALDRRLLCVLDRSRLRSVVPLLAVVFFTLALAALYFELGTYRYGEIVGAVRRYAPSVLVLAVLLTALSYAIMTGYDTLAFRYVGASRPYRETLLPSFVSYAVGNVAGFSPMTGGAIRYRLYTGRDVQARTVGRIVAFCTLCTWLGFVALVGVTFLVEPATFAATTGLPEVALRILGIVALGLVAGYLAAAIRHRPLRVREHAISVPSPSVAGTQLVLSSLDWVAAGSVLYVLVPAPARPPFFGFLGVFLVATLVGLASSVPGGLGVFEATLLALLPPSITTVGVVGALVVYRAVYFLLPLALGGMLLGIRALRGHHERVTRTARTFGAWGGRIVPDVAAVLVAAAGAVLLFAGALPASASQLGALAGFVPLSVIETSQFLGSLVGVLLLVVGRGLQRRLRVAFHLTTALLVFGTLLALFQGIVYEAALVQLGVLGVLVSTRRAFYRDSALTSVAFTPGWAAAVFCVFVASLWLGFVAYRDITYSTQLWWQFALDANAPRFLRASVGAAGVLFVFGLVKLLQPATPPAPSPTTEDLDTVRKIAERSPDRTAYLALLGDKSLLFDDARDAFVMYRRSGRTWVTMGGPLGSETNRAEAAWKYRELVSRNGGRPAFYEIGPDDLPLVLELGLTPYKLGEQARVPLCEFSLDGSARKNLRYTYRRARRDGCSFEVVPRKAVPEIMDALGRVSDDWLDAKDAREIGFSLGSFDETYLANFPVAVVRADDEIVAFANVLDAGGEMLSLDLMRYSSAAPPGAMEYLFIEIMLYGASEGYEWFDLGMAPLSGLDDRPLGPLWNRVGTAMYRHGERFYNYRGLRQYKEKFDPVWEPRYLACSGGAALPFVLLDVARLISGRADSTRPQPSEGVRARKVTHDWND